MHPLVRDLYRRVLLVGRDYPLPTAGLDLIYCRCSESKSLGKGRFEINITTIVGCVTVIPWELQRLRTAVVNSTTGIEAFLVPSHPDIPRKPVVTMDPETKQVLSDKLLA
jgi:hypothetical protein